jgi:hypothetical protein
MRIVDDDDRLNCDIAIKFTVNVIGSVSFEVMNLHHLMFVLASLYFVY